MDGNFLSSKILKQAIQRKQFDKQFGARKFMKKSKTLDLQTPTERFLEHSNKRRRRPPNLTGSKWTFFNHPSGWCHFHIITNEKRDLVLWIELMASCDRETRFWIPWDELAVPGKGWLEGWIRS